MTVKNKGILLTIFQSVSPSPSLSPFSPFSPPLFLVQCSLSVIIPIIRLSVCLSFCLSDYLHFHFVRLSIFQLLVILY